MTFYDSFISSKSSSPNYLLRTPTLLDFQTISSKKTTKNHDSFSYSSHIKLLRHPTLLDLQPNQENIEPSNFKKEILHRKTELDLNSIQNTIGAKRKSQFLSSNKISREKELSSPPNKSIFLLRQDTFLDSSNIQDFRSSGKLIPLNPFLSEIRIPKKGNISLGRHKNCDIKYPTDWMVVSSNHCIIFTDIIHQCLNPSSSCSCGLNDYNIAVFVKDTSSNGTFLNGKKLGKGQYSRIVDGDVLSLVSSSGWKNKEGTSISISYRFASENVNFKSSSSPRTPQKSGSFGQLPLNSSYRKLRKRVKSYSLCALCFILIICLFLLKLIPN